MRYCFQHFSVSSSLDPFLSCLQIWKIYFDIEGNVQKALSSNLFSHWDFSFTVQYFRKPQMKGLFPGYDNVIGSKVIVSISSHRKLFWSSSWGQKLSWWGEWGKEETASCCVWKALISSHFFTAHEKCPRMPSIAPAICSSHDTSFSTPLFFAKMEVIERTGRFQNRKDEKRKQCQDMFWRHFCVDTENTTEGALHGHVELLGGHQVLIPLQLATLLWPKTCPHLCSLNPSSTYETMKLLSEWCQRAAED